MTRAGWLGVLTSIVVAASSLALVVFLPFYPTIDLFLVVVAAIGGPLAGLVVHGSLTRRAMGLTGAWHPEAAAAHLAEGRGTGLTIGDPQNHLTDSAATFVDPNN